MNSVPLLLESVKQTPVCPLPLPALYTAGYQGHTPDALLALATRLNAGVLDVRLKPYSPNPKWRQYALRNLFFARYHHVIRWGNLRYKIGPPVQITDFMGGLASMRDWFADTPYTSAILLCCCRDAECCHRTTLARMLRERGYTVRELDWHLPAQAQSEAA